MSNVPIGQSVRPDVILPHFVGVMRFAGIFTGALQVRLPLYFRVDFHVSE